MPYLVLSDKALADLERLRRFYQDQSESAADKAIRSIRSNFPLLVSLPGIGQALPGKSPLREWKVRFGHAAYRVLYRVEGDALIVTRVQHSRERR